jgi:hypothetical protein
MRLGTWPGKRFRDRAAPQGFPPKKKIQPGATATLRLAVDLTLAGRFCSRFSGVTTRLKGNLSPLRPLVGDLAKRNAPGFDLSPFHAQSGSEYLLFFRVLTLSNGLTLRSSFPRVRESVPCFIFPFVR